MKYELRENQGIPAPLLALMAVAITTSPCWAVWQKSLR